MMKNNKSRSLVNIIGIPLIVTSILVGNYLFAIFISTIIILGTMEYISLLKKHSINPSSTLLYTFQIFLILLSFVYVKYQLFSIDESYHFNTYTFEIMLLTFFLPIILVFISMILEIFKKSSTSLFNISSTVFGFIWIGVFINSLVFLRFEAGSILTLVIFISLWTCDTFAFFFGKHFGKRKIIPEISPNKTLVGSISGLVGSIIFLLILSHFNIIELTLFQAFILALITGGISQFGDFFESLLKREVKIKDTSNILKGHGGILDRFDSLSIISPIILLFIYLIK